VYRGHLERLDHKGHRVASVFRARLEIPEILELQAAQDHLEIQDNKVRRVVLEVPDQLDLLEIQDRLGRPE